MRNSVGGAADLDGGDWVSRGGSTGRNSGRRRSLGTAGRVARSGRGGGSRRRRSRVDRDLRRAVGDDTRVLWDSGSADTDEVLDGLGLFLLGTAGGNTGKHVVSEVRDLAVAGRVGVVLALSVHLEPSVDTAGEDLRRSVTTWRRRRVRGRRRRLLGRDTSGGGRLRRRRG